MRYYILLASIALVPCTGCQRDGGTPERTSAGTADAPAAIAARAGGCDDATRPAVGMRRQA